ncbi:UPF0176 protein YceA [Seminavis robusta]|uniref:UPF0176 protein YceA n=1 Tax=Seminavis robusta TaxID=568900 RepID=A0A9N8ETR1_9STRA|nr:UPF0176 protein YceA [Seminavis robusta]|eukprot:Sro1926_g305870.1 UPF0176 protein YceA (914) ;mRNA; f:5479-8490
MFQSTNPNFVWCIFVVLFVVSLPSVASFQPAVPMRAAALRSRLPYSRSWVVPTVSRLFNTLSSNQDLAQKRIEVARAKKAAWKRSVLETNKRHLHIKRITEEKEQSTDFQVPALYALKVSVCEELRNELHLSGRERRGRVFIELGSPATRSLKSLKYDIHAFFKALKKSTFVLSACLPEVAEDGSIVVPEDLTNTKMWKIETDEDVNKTFAMADEHFQSAPASLKRPSISLHLAKDPNAPPPPPPPAYLEGMANPAASETMTMLSFYSFPPSGIEDPEDFAMQLRRKWKPFNPLGRIYVAKEGVNAQMSVATNVLENFIDCCRSIPQLGTYMENGVNVDPKPIPVEEFATAGVPINGKPAPPFRNLHIRVRNQIVADGLDKPLDWQSAGYDMPPLEWHEKLKEAKELREQAAGTTADQNKDIPVILDCRNDYETNIGKFDGAEPLETTNFRESWDVLGKRLEDVPKDAPIMTYCTGGIRCVKVGAYLTQELGFTNVSRLAGGIIAYDRTIEEKAADEQPLFRGANMVFDGRLGRQITDDKLGSCATCGGETSLISNCLNDNCHKRMIQCETCRTAFHGTCSDACRQRLVNNGMLSQRLHGDSSQTSVADSSEEKTTPYRTLDEYSTGHSSPAPSLYHEMELNTQSYLPSGSHMVSGFEQGRLLTNLASMTREGRILELGTFTGYATACFLEGAANVASAISLDSAGNQSSGPYVLSLERDQRAFNLAAAHMNVMTEHGTGEAGAEAACSLRASGEADFVETVLEDVVSVVYDNAATCDLLKVSDALATMEEMARGESSQIDQPSPFDLVFVDADKTRLLEYVDACLASDLVLKKGGMIVVDNVLWKGLVLGAAGSSPLLIDGEGSGDAEIKKNRRARRLASKMHRFNSAIAKDPRCEVLLLQVRDGLSMIRKK